MSVQDLFEKNQKECHEFVETIMKSNNLVTYQYATNLWMFHKLAELEFKKQNKSIIYGAVK